MLTLTVFGIPFISCFFNPFRSLCGVFFNDMNILTYMDLVLLVISCFYNLFSILLGFLFDDMNLLTYISMTECKLDSFL